MLSNKALVLCMQMLHVLLTVGAAVVVGAVYSMQMLPCWRAL